jgi:hypothetical protein
LLPSRVSCAYSVGVSGVVPALVRSSLTSSTYSPFFSVSVRTTFSPPLSALSTSGLPPPASFGPSTTVSTFGFSAVGQAMLLKSLNVGLETGPRYGWPLVPIIRSPTCHLPISEVE